MKYDVNLEQFILPINYSDKIHLNVKIKIEIKQLYVQMLCLITDKKTQRNKLEL